MAMDKDSRLEVDRVKQIVIITAETINTFKFSRKITLQLMEIKKLPDQ